MDRLHDDGGNLPLVLADDFLKLSYLVVVERQYRAAQPSWNAFRLESGEQMVVESFGILQVGRQVPIGPAVVAAKCNDVAACVGARDPGSDRHRFTAGTRVAHHIG